MTHALRTRLVSVAAAGVAPWALATRVLKEALAAAPALREAPDAGAALALARGGAAVPIIEVSRSLNRLSSLARPKSGLARSRQPDARSVIEDAPAALLAGCAALGAPLVALYPHGAAPEVAGVDVWHPADGVELAVAWSEAVARRGPTAIVLSAWLPPVLDRPAPLRLRDVARGVYLAAGAPADRGGPPITIVATGAELAAALDLRRELALVNVGLRVIAAPAPRRLAALPAATRRQLLGAEHDLLAPVAVAA